MGGIHLVRAVFETLIPIVAVADTAKTGAFYPVH